MSSSSAFDAETDADQVEAAAMKLGSWVPAANGLRDDLVSDTMLEAVPPSGAASTLYDHKAVDAELDSRVGAVAAEMARRKALLGSAYPFEFDPIKQSARHKASPTLVYEFCLAVSHIRSFNENPFARLPRVFERLTGRVVAAFLGEGADWYRTGWPPEGDRPTRYREVMAELQTRTSEWHWRPHPELLDDPGPKTVKDGGIDIVVWKYPPDTRGGGVTLVGQCACGNDWTGKTNDLSFDRVDQWVPRRTVGKELRFFALPRHIPNPESWVSYSHSAGIIFDRARFALLASRLPDPVGVRTMLLPMVELVLPFPTAPPTSAAVVHLPIAPSPPS